MIDSRLFCIDSAVHLIQSILIEVLEVKSQLMYTAAHKLSSATSKGQKRFLNERYSTLLHSLGLIESFFKSSN